jgi:predicted transcriptional regulator
MNEYKELTDAEFKVLQFIRNYNQGRKTYYVPSTDYIADQLNKGRTTAFRIMASLRRKGINV